MLSFLFIHFSKRRYSHLHSTQRLLPQDYATDTFFSIYPYGKIEEVTNRKSVRERSLKEQRGGWKSLQGAVESYEESWWGVALCQQAKSLSKGEGWGKTRNGKLILLITHIWNLALCFCNVFLTASGLKLYLTTTKTLHPSFFASVEKEVCCRRRGDSCYRNGCLLPLSLLFLLLPLSSSLLNFSPQAVSLLHISQQFLHTLCVCCKRMKWSTDKAARSFSGAVKLSTSHRKHGGDVTVQLTWSP